MTRIIRLLPIAAILLLSAPFPAHAQVVGATLTGTVHDPSGATVSGATVTIRQTETGGKRVLVTDAEGRFFAPSIPVGPYTVTVEHDGFARQEQSGITLTIGQSLQLNFALTVAGVNQEVVVDAAGPSVNTTTQQTAGLVDERQVKELPLNGRSYDELLTLNPATVNYSGERSGGIGSSNSSVGNMFSVSGRRPQDNLFLLNGIEYTGASLINVTPGGTSGELLGVDAVREFNVVTDTYGAEYGKRDGAQVSIVTSSGTNQLHGTAFEFLRNSALDARNYFDQGSIPQVSAQPVWRLAGRAHSQRQALPLRQLRGIPPGMGIERGDACARQPGTPGLSAELIGRRAIRRRECCRRAPAQSLASAERTRTGQRYRRGFQPSASAYSRGLRDHAL